MQDRLHGASFNKGCSHRYQREAPIGTDDVRNVGYIYGQSVRGADAEFKAWVFGGDEIIDACANIYGLSLNDKYKTQQEIQRLLRY